MSTRLKTLLSRKRLLVLCAICVTAAAVWSALPRPCVLRLGIFAGSNWDVPGADTYTIIDDAIARFEQAHPAIQVEYESGIRKEDYSRWLNDRLLEGRLPDVFLVLDDEFPTLAKIDALQNLDGWAAGTDGIDPAQFYQAALDGGKWENTLYGLPYESNAQFMFVNLTLLEKEGIAIPEEDWTLDELYDICKKITKDTDGDGRLDQFGIYSYGWQNAVLAYDERVFEADGSAARLQNRNVQKAIDYAFSLDALNENTPVSAADFDEGRVAFSPLTYAEYKTYKPYPWKIKKFSRFDWSIIPMPAAKPGKTSSSVDSLVMAISSKTAHPKEAWQLLKTLCYDADSRQMIMEHSQGLPSTRLPLADPEQSGSQEKLDERIIEHVMDHSRNLSRFPSYTHMISLLDSSLRSGYPLADDKDIFMIDLQNLMNEALRSR